MVISTRGLNTAAALAFTLSLAVSAGSAHAQIANTCAAGKVKCIKAKADKVTGCYATFLKKPIPNPPAGTKLSECLGKALGKFNDCIAKVEDKQKPAKPETLCPFTGDGTVLGNLTFAFVATDIVLAVHPAIPTSPNTCAASKLKCATKKAKALLCCHEKALKKGESVDLLCLQKARDKFDGGAEPAKGCFAKLEAKQKVAKPATVCPTAGDVAPIEITVDGFVTNILSQIQTGAPPPM